MSLTARSPAQLRSMFGSNLRRLSSDYASISALARDLGINRTQFNRYLSGESFPRPDVLARICEFFSVDARVLLEPVDQISPRTGPISSEYLRDFMGPTVHPVSEEELPSGFYQFARRSFVRNDQYVRGLVLIKRDGDNTFLRGFEPKIAMAMQGIPADARAREYRGFIMHIEDGFAATVARRNGMTASFNYLSRVTSFQNNFWVGYVARTVRESSSGTRMTRLVYEYIGDSVGRVLSCARNAGFCQLDELMPFHQRLLQPNDPFR
ncbi:helix-turn-helix domain-containing protein [Roseobacter sp. WL0113]|uniref:Helix-turn-helix domain-containing protein n=2 Tax=Roseobacter sinensis TaxID=2931391 RepID=A0ABT3BBT6_9RHOB|nr:helix-turn-helix transcriptional regulator [Roseobacter sp. WL0113]MCV3271041.1 helix-turn-helix domain-containing protein [Roseobacter sp. WL0113]